MVAIDFIFFHGKKTAGTFHVSSSDGEAKIWLEPRIEVARVVNFSAQEVNKILEIIGDRQEEINDFWNRHFM